ncbi:MAG: hypothetical protein D6731_24920, partial [Planctomycetota bacterium]
GACDLVYRVPVEAGASPGLPPSLAAALPLLLHEFERQPGLPRALAREAAVSDGPAGRVSPKTTLSRILLRLLSYRLVEGQGVREFVFDGYRASSIHVLSRVLESGVRFRLEDLSHFATHGEFLLAVLHVVGLPRALDPEGIVYCPALDAPYPFKFAIVGDAGVDNRLTYVRLLKAILRQSESDEEFRARNFRELIRGFAKFGPAAATPQFQEVELRLWRILSYLAARLRVKAGRLIDTRDVDEVRQFLGELRDVHDALDELVHLPGRAAAFFRKRFDLELSSLHEFALEDLDGIAARIDFGFDDMERSIDQVAQLVSEFRRLGSASPLETLEEQDRDIKLAYGDVEVPPLETGWARTYTDRIFTGAERFDTRRYAREDGEPAAEEEVLSEEDFSLDVDLDFGLGGNAEGESGDDSAWGEDEDGANQATPGEAGVPEEGTFSSEIDSALDMFDEL